MCWVLVEGDEMSQISKLCLQVYRLAKGQRYNNSSEMLKLPGKKAILLLRGRKCFNSSKA